MYFRQEIGRWGENLACKYLEENNYKIIDRNFLCRQGEIDIIAKDCIKNELVFFFKILYNRPKKYGKEKRYEKMAEIKLNLKNSGIAQKSILAYKIYLSDWMC